MISLRNFYVFIFLLLSGIIASRTFSQNDKPGFPVKEYELEQPAKQLWYKIKDEWMLNEYPLCMAETRLKMSCSGCSSVFIRVIITIDQEGKITEYKKINEKICGKKADIRLEKCFFKFFETITFPEELRNIKIETTLGTGLKC